ncbi:sciellin isoform X5 [Danio aesculapii]|uniref:sciellin isoform X5 n=1 Tax=Danio aesculapii TaxID=1142201 RepID=UPI0024C08B14|nr:sciellin isoform X5 [Danio aesculapii]
MSFTGKSSSQSGTTSSTGSINPVSESKRTTSLLKDNSWIKANVNEDQKAEQETNYGKTVLSRYKSNENLTSPQDKTSKTETKTTTVTTSPGSSVQALSKKFGGSQDKLKETRTTSTKTSVKSQPRTSTTSTTTTVKNGTKTTETTVTTTKQDVVKSSTKPETVIDRNLADSSTRRSGDYKTTKQEVITVNSSKDTIDGPSSPVKTPTSIKSYTKEEVSPAKTTSYSVQSTKSSENLTPTSIKTTNTRPEINDSKTEMVAVKSSKTIIDTPASPVKTTTSIKTYTKEDVTPPKTTTYSVRSTKSSEDLTPTSIKLTSTKPDISDYKTEVVTVKSSKDIIDMPASPVKTTTSIKSYTKEDDSPTTMTSYSIRSTKSSEDLLYDTLIPTSIKSTNSKPDSSREDLSSSKTVRTVYSTSDRNEWSTVTSPSYTRTSYTESRPYDYLSDSLTSKTTTTVYSSPERKVNVKDICTYCSQSMYTDEKIILDDMNINCHARCFKCGVCNTSLGNLKAGDSLWVYRRAIHCESCFGVTKSKWNR